MISRVLPARVSRKSFFQTVLLSIVVLACLIAARPTARAAAAAGSISGRVTSSTNGLGLQGTVVQFFGFAADDFVGTTVTDVNGDYTMNLAAGAYAVLTQDNHGHINEIYNNIQCSSTCDTSNVAVIDVTTTAVTGINFVLDPGGRVAGTVTNSSNGQPIQGVQVQFLPTVGDQFPFTTAVTDASGNYISPAGIATGNVLVVTFNNQGFRDEVWDNIYCLGCDPGDLGTPIAVTAPSTTGGINFALDPGAQITGNVTDFNATPVANLAIAVYDSFNNWVASPFTDAQGNYATPGLPSGSYRVGTWNAGMLVDELYNNIPCPQGFCDVLTGTLIPLTAPNVTSNINFVLAAGGKISGTVTAAAGATPLDNVFVNITNGAGFFTGAQTDQNGFYTTGAMPPGTYFAIVNGVPGFAAQIYNGVNCSQFCNTNTGTPINVVANQTNTNINFALVPGGAITGTVTNAANGTPIANEQVQLFSSSGVNLASVSTNASGVYTFNSVQVGSFYVRTNGQNTFVNQLYPGVTCVNCNVTTSGGSLVQVTANNTTGNINFALAIGGRISGTITNANGGAALQNIQAQVFGAGGIGMGNTNTNASGVFTSFAVPAGTYYVRTNNTLGFVNELWDNIPCPGSGGSICIVTTGTPISVTVGATTGNINFALVLGGTITGTVTNQATGLGIANLQVQLFNSSGTSLGTINTNASGVYTTSGLPAANYFVRTSNNLGFLDELYDNIPCNGCNVTTGTPVAVTAGATTANINFALVAGGGSIAGTVTDASTGQPLVGINVQIITPGAFIKSQNTNASGQYSISGLPAGTYYARTLVSNTQPYVNEIYNNVPCHPTCSTNVGTAINVVDGATQSGINFSLAPNLVQNGRFDFGTNNWQLFATPDMSFIVSQIVGGVFEYYRNPSPGNQAVIFQNTGMAVANNTALTARFSLGNSSSVRKRISVLLIEHDFSDIAVCTFWIPANTALTAYRMQTHTTKAWTNASLYFYAATAGSNGGFYRLDDVALEIAPGGATNETECVDPFVPVPPSGTTSGELLVNGDFNSGTLPPWQTFGTITSQIAAGVFEFIRNPGQPAGVVFQSTNQPMSSRQIMTATFQLGNSSGVRKRVTAILHDSNFSDLHACTFWLPPGQPLSNYAVQTYATQAWTNATLSIYGATAGPEQWIRLDNASLTRTPSAAISGTNCLEPGAALNNAPASVAESTAIMPMSVGVTTAAGSDPAQVSVGSDVRTMLDLSATSDPRLSVRSWLIGDEDAVAEVQVSADGVNWVTVGIARASDTWETLDLDLHEFAGRVITVRFVVTPAVDHRPVLWQVGSMTVR